MKKDNKKKTDEESITATIPVTPEMPVMYIGPDLRNPIPLQRGTVFSGDLPKPLQKVMATSISLAALFLPLAKARDALHQLIRGKGEMAQELTKHAKAVMAEAPTWRI